MSKSLRIDGVELRPDGGVVFNFDDDGAAKRLPLEPEDVAALMRLLASAMAGRAGLELDAHDVLMKPPAATGELPRLAFLSHGWPTIAMALDWKVLQGLAQAADAALQASPRAAQAS